MKRQGSGWERISAIATPLGELIYSIYKVLVQCNNNKTNDQA